MSRAFEAVRVSEHVWWVGAIDWSLRDFHGYSTQRGSTYNAYLVTGEYPVLVDTVKAPFRQEMLERIASVVDPTSIRVIISNHAEMDHSGSLVDVAQQIKPEKVLASRQGAANLHAHFHDRCEITVVDDAETRVFGGLGFTFLETPMLHWPDSMVTYLAEDRLLFSQDGFGMHLAGAGRFWDDYERAVLHYEAKKYYANILLPYSNLVLRLLERVRSLGLVFDVIAPDHGPVWRGEGIPLVLEWWREWAAQRPTNRAVVVYDTMWQSTGLMARAIADGLAGAGVQVSLIPLCCASRSDAMTELLGAGALVVGTPTINNGMFPTLADFLAYARGLKPSGLVGAAFGSYGWSGEGARQVEKALREMGVEVVAETLNLKFVPDAESLTQCREFGSRIAAALQERMSR